MRKFFLYCLFLLLFLLNASGVRAAEASAAISVTDQTIGININGRGFGNFILTVGTGLGQDLSLIFQANSGGCSRFSRSPNFTSFQCSIVDAGQETWSASTSLSNTFALGTYNVRLSDGQSFIVNESFTVGPSTTHPLTVTIFPPGPFINDTENTITVSWSPPLAARYIVDTTIPGLETLPIQDFSSGCPCFASITVPINAPPGTHTITVTQEGNAANTGSTTFVIDSATVARPSPPATPTPIQNVLIRCDPGDTACLSCVGPDAANPAGIPTAFGCIQTNAASFINRIFTIALGLAGGIALLLIIYSGYRMIAAAGNPEGLQGARETLTAAIVGLLFVIFSLVILEVIGFDILRIPGFGN